MSLGKLTLDGVKSYSFEHFLPIVFLRSNMVMVLLCPPSPFSGELPFMSL